MWKLTDAARATEGIGGVPWRDMTEEEFAAVEEWYDAQFSPEQRGSLRQHFTRELLITPKTNAAPAPAAATMDGGND